MIILRSKKYQQRDFSNAGVYAKRTLIGIGQGAVSFGLLGGFGTGFNPIGLLAGAIIGGTIGGIIGASSAKHYTPEALEKEKKEEKERKTLYNQIYKDYGFDRLIKIYQNPKIKELLEKSDCWGWDDYIYATIAFESKPCGYFRDDARTIAWFGNVDEDGELKLNFNTKKVTLGEKIVTPLNFKNSLLQYFQRIISRWEKDFKDKGEDAGCNREFILLQKEIYNQVKQQL